MLENRWLFRACQFEVRLRRPKPVRWSNEYKYELHYEKWKPHPKNATNEQELFSACFQIFDRKEMDLWTQPWHFLKRIFSVVTSHSPVVLTSRCFLCSDSKPPLSTCLNATYRIKRHIPTQCSQHERSSSCTQIQHILLKWKSFQGFQSNLLYPCSIKA